VYDGHTVTVQRRGIWWCTFTVHRIGGAIGEVEKRALRVTMSGGIYENAFKPIFSRTSVLGDRVMQGTHHSHNGMGDIGGDA
jgi:hypothetical protein